MRIDKLLWQLRLTRSRTAAQALVAAGHIRRNGQRVTRASHEVRVGDTLTVPLGAAVRVIEIAALPARRGPASEAAACYRDLDRAGETALAQPLDHSPERGHPQ